MEQKDKDIELYKASLTAFFQNELEHDKIILGLSTAGIGFFIAILTPFNGSIFVIENQIYERGNLFFVFLLIPLFYLIVRLKKYWQMRTIFCRE